MKLSDLTIAERIVWLFEQKVTEAHRGAIETPLKITSDEFNQASSQARDLGVARGLRITPVYEREGWWTSEPTQRIAAKAVHETLKRNRGEAERHARVYAKFGDLDGFTKWHSASTEGTLTAYLTGLGQLEVSSGADYVLDRIDAAVAKQRGYVQRSTNGADPVHSV